MSKKGLYWICQVGGWLFFVLFNSLLVKLGNAFNADVAKSLGILLVFGILISHIYRNLIIKLAWLKISTLRLLPRVIIASVVFASFLEVVQFLAEWIIDIAEI